jgi:hypothetical protein
MTAQPIPIEKDPPEPDITAPDDRERLIESLADFLSAGRPFSDVLVDAKRLAGCLSEPTCHIAPEEKGTVAENSGVTSQETSAIQLGRLTGRLAFWSVQNRQ